MAKVYVVTVYDSAEGDTSTLKVTENKDEAFEYAAELNKEWEDKGDYSEATVSVHEFESRFEKALKEIEAITRGLGDFNPTYDKIHKIASEALGVNENE